MIELTHDEGTMSFVAKFSCFFLSVLLAVFVLVSSITMNSKHECPKYKFQLSYKTQTYTVFFLFYLANEKTSICFRIFFSLIFCCCFMFSNAEKDGKMYIKFSNCPLCSKTAFNDANFNCIVHNGTMGYCTALNFPFNMF